MLFGFIRYATWTRCNSFIVRNKQTKTSNRKFPEDPFRNVERTLGFSTLFSFSDTIPQLFAARKREDTKKRDKGNETFETNGEGSKAGK